MAEKAGSPFAGLDRALLRSTKPSAEPMQRPADAAPTSTEPSSMTDTATSPDTRTSEHVHARTRAHPRERTPSRPSSKPPVPLVDVLFRVLQDKQHLASSTFRFRPQELEELDAVFAQVSKTSGRRVSKNDLVRLGLTWLLQEYKRGNSSVLAQVLRRL